MKRLLLERLTLRNFKGFRDFTLQANGGAVDVYGDNATGKTTIFDAFSWLLFGKDSANRADFEIKELDSAGKVRQHKLEHEVEGVLVVDGRRKSFRRVFSEKWTKKRGSLNDSWEGHETAYYVDGVPTTKRDYDAEVANLMPEELFKLLTNPAYFNEQMKWQERRKLLLDVCGDVTDAEVIHDNKDLSPLAAILAERDIDKHKAVLSERMKRINKDIADIPVRISEAQRSMPDVSDLSENMLREDAETLRARAADKEQELMRIRAGGQVADLQRRIAEIDSEQLRIKSDLQTAALDKVAQQRNLVVGLRQQDDTLRREIEDKQYTIKTNERRIEGFEQERSVLRTEFMATQDSVFVHAADDNCPACGQLLPEMRRKEAHEKALADHNRRRAERLESIQKRGHAAKAESERLAAENERLAEEVKSPEADRAALAERITEAESELERLRGGIQDPAHDDRWIKLQQERTALAQEIDDLHAETAAAERAVCDAIAGLRAEIAQIETELAKFDQARRQQGRIAELEADEKRLAAEYEQAQHELFMVEEFTRTKVNMLQSRIDSKFKLARFRLFDEQINGGLREVCDTLYNGVPYDGGLNNAARINVGLDVINTLSKHYGVLALIFVDNAEAVTRLIDTDSQVIRLIVSAADKKLRIETHNDMREAI